MNKILVQVVVPTIEKSFDILLPINKKLGRAIVLINKSVNELTNGSYPIKEDSILCSITNGRKYNNDNTVKEAGLQNGSKVILI